MKGTYSNELISNLKTKLNLISLNLIESTSNSNSVTTPSTPSTANLSLGAVVTADVRVDVNDLEERIQIEKEKEEKRERNRNSLLFLDSASTSSASTTSISSSSTTTQSKQITIKSLLHHLNLSFPPTAPSSSSNSESNQQQSNSSSSLEPIELILLTKLTINLIGLVIEELINEVELIELEENYWRKIERKNWEVGVYLIQTSPNRILKVVNLTLSKLRSITTAAVLSTSSNNTESARGSVLTLSLLKSALPTPNLVLATLFPHLSSSSSPPSSSSPTSFNATSTNSFSSSIPTKLSTKSIKNLTRKLFLLPLSPLLLTKQEINLKLLNLNGLKEELVIKIGEISLGLNEGGRLGGVLSNGDANGERGDLTKEDLEESTKSTILLLSSILSSIGTSATTSPKVTSINYLPQLLHSLLSTIYPLHHSQFHSNLSPLVQPSALTKSWPYLLSVPILTYILSKSIYSSRITISNWLELGKETVRGFLIDWVVKPIEGILETIRHNGSEGRDGMIMSKESLRSDLESLERMVLEFGKDQYNLSPSELQELSEKVKVGDLTSVLKVWEKDIKSPIRSAVSGSLIRTLLIQVQKVKVDVALAMDGIEKMLKSQQLTFGFVGVAPSMIILFSLINYIKGFVKNDGSRSRLNKKEIQLRNWCTMRQLDSILSPTSSSVASSTSTIATKFKTQGNLLLSLHSLRSYAESNSFPQKKKNPSLKDYFLEDIRELENSGISGRGAEGVKEGDGKRRYLIERMWRWSTLLGWEERV